MVKPFDEFSQYVKHVQDYIQQEFPNRIKESWFPDRAILTELFCRSNIMKSEVQLVGASKVLAHLLPDYVMPMDREYTLYFLKGSTAMPTRELDWFFTGSFRAGV